MAGGHRTVSDRWVFGRVAAPAAALLLAAAASVAARQEPASGAPPEAAAGPPPLSAGLGAADLEALREVVIRHYRDQPGDWDAPKIEELTRGAVFLAGELSPGSPPAIGSWRLEEVDGRTALVRRPPPPAELPAPTAYVGVYVDRTGGAWRVTGEYLLEEWLVEVERVEDPGERQLGRGDCTGRGGATLRAGESDLFLPLDELERIRREVERYLAEEKPEMDASVFGPGEAFVDCQGVPRMGAWILEAGTAEGELRLAFRIHTGDAVIVRQVIGLERRGEAWRATGTSRVIAHLRH